MVTFIVPTIAERSALLDECLASIDAQTTPAAGALVGLDRQRLGPASIRNALVAQADTEYVAFLDDDDVIYPTYLERLSPHLADADVVYSWCDTNFGANLAKPFDADRLRQYNFVPVTTIVRTELFRQVGGFPTDVAHEDHALWLRLLDIGARFCCVPERLWCYRRQPQCRTLDNDRLLAAGSIRRV